MSDSFMQKHLPTIAAWQARLREARLRQLPEHLRPRPLWPLWFHLFINTSVFFTLWYLMLYRDDFFSEAGPAFALGVCTFVLIATLAAGVDYRRTLEGMKGHRLATWNLRLVFLTFLCLAAAIVTFMN